MFCERMFWPRRRESNPHQELTTIVVGKNDSPKLIERNEDVSRGSSMITTEKEIVSYSAVRSRRRRHASRECKDTHDTRKHQKRYDDPSRCEPQHRKGTKNQMKDTPGDPPALLLACEQAARVLLLCECVLCRRTDSTVLVHCRRSTSWPTAH